VQSVSPAVQAAPAGPVQLPLPAQHGIVVEHDWPERPQIGIAMSVLGGWPAMSPGGGGGARQWPVVEPGGTTQTPAPGQQSAVVVQTPPAGAHMEPQCRWPIESGTQGKLLQQSAAEAQVPLGGTHMPMPKHRRGPTGRRRACPFWP
jgi:hypothetical protein